MPPMFRQASYSGKSSASPTGTKGAPWPPNATSCTRKSLTTGSPQASAKAPPSPICRVKPLSGWWKTVCPCEATSRGSKALRRTNPATHSPEKRPKAA